jgi:hypothetical protein
MLPLTHFLVGLALGVWGFDKGLFGREYVLYTAFASILIDLDHLVGYFTSGGGSLREHWNRLALDRLRYKSTLVHHVRGIVVVCLVIALTYFAERRVFYCLALAYVSHMVLDHLHIRHLPHVRKYHLKGLGIVLPYSIIEVLLDVLLIVYLGLWAIK